MGLSCGREQGPGVLTDTVLCSVQGWLCGRDVPLWQPTAGHRGGGPFTRQAWGAQQLPILWAQVCLPPGWGVAVCCTRPGEGWPGGHNTENFPKHSFCSSGLRALEKPGPARPALSLPSPALSVRRDNLAGPGSPTSRLTTAEGWGLPGPLHPLDAEAGRSLSSCSCLGWPSSDPGPELSARGSVGAWEREEGGRDEGSGGGGNGEEEREGGGRGEGGG